jgi:RNA polymerase sigma factor (sigma-70 family)
VPGEEDRARFTAVFLPHLTQAHRLARWLTGNTADAEDVVQDAALKAFRNIRGFSGGNARAWVLTIVRNSANTWLVKNRRGPANAAHERDQHGEELNDAHRDTETPEVLLLRKAEANEIRHAVAELPDVFREVIVLREMQDLDYREIAGVIGAPIGTVMSRLARARRMLIDRLGETQ